MPRVRAARVLVPRLPVVPLVAVVAALAVLAGCSTEPRSSPSPRPLPSPTTAGVVLPTMDMEQPGLTPGTGQSDSEQLGPIWNTVPPAFPEPPGGQRTEVAGGTGPVSGAWTVPAAVLPTRDVAQFYLDAFARVGYGGMRDGPLEDGSYTAWASNGYGCDIFVTAVPRGSDETLATVLYGAGCPFSWPAE